MPAARRFVVSIVVSAAAVLALSAAGPPPPATAQSDLDVKVKAFLDASERQWRDLNVPAVDGQTLHDIVVSHKYTRALEIGTSTGHSSIWIAWALSQTGGKLITIDIDERRQRIARENFAASGVAPFIETRLGDAHEIVPALKGPFDFVFSDADKDWYRNYLDAVLPKLEPGGCFATHNVFRDGGGWGRRQGGEYANYLLTVPSLETTFDTRGGGLAISYKKR